MIMRKLKAKFGFTMAETLLVVAIIGILAAVIFVSVVNYLRSSTKLEYDGYSKSIFVAAQNHLSMAEHEGYLGRSDFGIAESDDGDIRYFVVINGVLQLPSGVDASDCIFDLMLPSMAIDDTVRSGSYIIRYQKSAAQVLDVFFWDQRGRYAYTYSDSDYGNLLNMVLGTDRNGTNANPDGLRNYTDDGSVVGWYGGADALAARGPKLTAPTLQLVNAERLYAKVDYPNSSEGAMVKLVVKGLSSNKVAEFTLNPELTGGNISWNDSNFEIVLDDITEKSKKFCSILAFQDFYPGENISVYAVAFNNQEITNVAYSAEQTTNSLFQDLQVDSGAAALTRNTATISIGNIRHLENLDPAISKFKVENVSYVVKQTTDLNWQDYIKKIKENLVNTSIANARVPDISIHVFIRDGGSSEYDSGNGEIECYEPISPSYALAYDGQGHSIRNLKINTSGHAGMFGELESSITVQNLTLEDCTVRGGSSAGTLAGKLSSSEDIAIENVLVLQTKDYDVVHVTASSGHAGGLIGAMRGADVKACAAAVRVESDEGSYNSAGGLIGLAQDSTITACYSAGITKNGLYQQDTANVRMEKGKAGGLVGDLQSSTISTSYSTSSVRGKTAGGLVGNAKDSKITNSYCTGLVSYPEDKEAAGAFAGKIEATKLHIATSEDVKNYYFYIINPGLVSVGSADIEYSDKVLAFDADTVSYQSFVSSGDGAKKRAAANPYDDTLNAYYQGGYNLKTVAQLGYDSLDAVLFVGQHYGDWPAPETLVLNEKGNP